MHDMCQYHHTCSNINDCGSISKLVTKSSNNRTSYCSNNIWQGVVKTSLHFIKLKSSLQNSACNNNRVDNSNISEHARQTSVPKWSLKFFQITAIELVFIDILNIFSLFKECSSIFFSSSISFPLTFFQHSLLYILFKPNCVTFFHFEIQDYCCRDTNK